MKIWKSLVKSAERAWHTVKSHQSLDDRNTKTSHADTNTRPEEKSLNSSPSKLLEVPAEIRNQIYDYVLFENEIVVCPCAFPALLHTCKKTRAEAKNIFFATNTFHMAPEMDRLLKRYTKRCNLFRWLEVVDRIGSLEHISKVFITRGLVSNWYGTAVNLPKKQKGSSVHLELQIFESRCTSPYHWDMFVGHTADYSTNEILPLRATRYPALQSAAVNRGPLLAGASCGYAVLGTKSQNKALDQADWPTVRQACTARCSPFIARLMWQEKSVQDWLDLLEAMGRFSLCNVGKSKNLVAMRKEVEEYMHNRGISFSW